MIGGNDSLNNFITKAGGQLSFGNKFRRARQPNGANFHTGQYYGPPENGPGSVGDSDNAVTKAGTLTNRERDEDSDFRRSNYLSQRDVDAQVSASDKAGSLSSLLSPTPDENEDPVHFGFEIIIDDRRSPLLNGQVLDFVDSFGVSNSEIKSRGEIYNGTLPNSSENVKSFLFQMQKFFKFKGEIGSPASLSPNRRRHYIKKIEGLNLLIEKNGASKPNSFIKYREDLLKISFYEDTNLSTGYLINLYKLLYWSRLRGKSVIPENLLRFDCQIIVSEVRNIARVVKALGVVEETTLDGTLTRDQRKIERLEKRNERRGNLRPRQQNTLDRLKKEEEEEGKIRNNLQVIEENVSRYIYNVYECQFHFDQMMHPGEIDLETSSVYQNGTINLSFKFSDMTYEKFSYNGLGWNVDRLKNSRLDPRGVESNDIDTNLDTSSGSIKPFKTLPKKIDLIKGNFKRTLPPDSALTSLGKNLKKALLSEGQRRLNDQFRLLNNAIDKVRDSFGLGRMSAPTNVYDIPPNGGRLFFDVKNSLRNFVGDSLSNSIFGRGGQ